MNVEFEVRAVISGSFSINDKIKLIQNISNFKDEDIINAFRKKYESEKNLSGQIYAEMVRLSWIKK
jgi:membrane protease subunit (stomatin/prohibitin family)